MSAPQRSASVRPGCSVHRGEAATAAKGTREGFSEEAEFELVLKEGRRAVQAEEVWRCGVARCVGNTRKYERWDESWGGGLGREEKQLEVRPGEKQGCVMEGLVLELNLS